MPVYCDTVAVSGAKALTVPVVKSLLLQLPVLPVLLAVFGRLIVAAISWLMDTDYSNLAEKLLTPSPACANNSPLTCSC